MDGPWLGAQCKACESPEPDIPGQMLVSFFVFGRAVEACFNFAARLAFLYMFPDIAGMIA